MKFYRYEAVSYASLDHDGEYVRPSYPNVKIVLTEFSLHKETPKGYRIGYGTLDSFHGDSRWVSKTAKKRYAYPTKEEAMTNYIKRTERRVSILKAQLLRVEIGLGQAKAMQKTEKEFN